MILRTTLFLAFLVTLLAGCRKDQLFSTDPASLEFSEPEVLFDTIFTQVPFSVTKRFRVYNRNENAVRVDVALEGGTPSPFRINVDGATGVSFEDVEILGGDSIYVFVEASLDQANSNNPFVFEDHVLFNTNGTEQSVKLVAWGQDAHFFYADTCIQGLPCFSWIAGPDCETVNWVNDKPYVIYGYAVVDSCCTLIIDPGVRVYVHGGGGLWIYRWGRILAEGTQEEPITFQSDRLEPLYAELPGQWDRIWINDGPAGNDNVLENVVVKNALIGIQCETWPLVPDAPTSEAHLVLNNVKIRNCSAAGILSRNYTINSTNLLVGDCGQYSVALTGGGGYNFDHTTIANYWNYGVRQTPAFIMTNTYGDINGALQVRDITTSVFQNSIIYGSNVNEFQLEFDAGLTPDIYFKHMLLRTDQSTNDPQFFDVDWIFRNQDPQFHNITDRDFHLNGGSPAINRGLTAASTEALLDLDGVDRIGGETDLGCFEFVP
ncbi:MAG: choice-of-anchor Q domain-containing protein [Flavobacteriales bacterium]